LEFDPLLLPYAAKTNKFFLKQKNDTKSFSFSLGTVRLFLRRLEGAKHSSKQGGSPQQQHNTPPTIIRTPPGDVI
jgi:hypothetical protein